VPEQGWHRTGSGRGLPERTKEVFLYQGVPEAQPVEREKASRSEASHCRRTEPIAGRYAHQAAARGNQALEKGQEHQPGCAEVRSGRETDAGRLHVFHAKRDSELVSEAAYKEKPPHYVQGTEPVQEQDHLRGHRLYVLEVFRGILVPTALSREYHCQAHETAEEVCEPGHQQGFHGDTEQCLQEV